MKKPSSQSLDHLLHEERSFPPSDAVRRQAHIGSVEQYQEMYRSSLDDSDACWLEQAEQLLWIKPPTKACSWKWDPSSGSVEHRWFEDGQLNISSNCLDRHLTSERRDKVALLWQGEDPDNVRRYTYAELHREVCQLANVFVTCCMPMPCAYTSSLADNGRGWKLIFRGLSRQNVTSQI